MATLSATIGRGLDASKPAASEPGRVYYASDTKKTYRDNGTSWDDVSDAGSIASANKGRATLSAGTVTVSAIAASSSAVILVTNVAPSSVIGALSVGTITDGVGFVINSTESADTSTVAWAIL